MARPIVLSNGELHVGINLYGLVHDFSYPHVAKENHTIGKNLRHRVGVWTGGQISWLDDEGAWEFNFSYPDDSLIGLTTATNHNIGIRLEMEDCVYSERNVFVRNVHVVNLWDNKRDVRLFMHQAFIIGDSQSKTDTVQYLPNSDAIVHYRGRRVFAVSGCHDDKPFDQHSVGLFGIEGREGTYRDADDGELSCSVVEHGRVDSTLRFKLDLAPKSSSRVYYWIAAGTSLHNALFAHRKLQKGALDVINTTRAWWQNWLTRTQQASEHIPARYSEMFKKSAMIVKSHIDKHGATIASTDSAMLNYGRDAYGYCWPRDGAYTMWPLIRMGYVDEPKRFFEFCKRVMHPKGYLGHKFLPDGALGSSWHSYTHAKGVTMPPIQEDETALTLFVFAQLCFKQNDKAYLRDNYKTFVIPMAEFLNQFIDLGTNLPRPSYDLWEEVFLTTTYTTSVTYAALLAAADLADQMNDTQNAVTWRQTAENIKQAAHKHLYNSDKKAFYKGLYDVNDEIEYNTDVDASAVFGAFTFGLFDINSEELKNSVDYLRKNLQQKNSLGIPRYENDNYHRLDGQKPNSWFITTLWHAQYCIETGEYMIALKILDWVQAHTYSSGVLAEQISPDDSQYLSVAPLTWSHAEFMATVLDLIGGEKNNETKKQ